MDCKEIQLVHSEGDQPWDFFGRNDAKAETPVLWPPHVKSWLIGKDWEGLGAGGEGDDRGWDGWMASLTRWRWVWVNSGNRWWTGKPGVLRFMGSQRVGHDWLTELNWTEVASVVSDSVRTHRGQPTRLPCPWDPPCKNTGVDCHFPLQCVKVKEAFVKSILVFKHVWLPVLQTWYLGLSMSTSKMQQLNLFPQVFSY